MNNSTPVPGAYWDEQNFHVWPIKPPPFREWVRKDRFGGAKLTDQQ